MPLGIPRRLGALLQARPRKQSLSHGRALVEFRGVRLQALPELDRRLKALAAELPEIEWVELNPYLRRAVFAVGSDPDRRIDLEVLEAMVRQAERGCPDWGEALPGERELPDDTLLHLQSWVELVADSAGLGLGMMLRLVPFVPRTLGADTVFLLTLVQGQARLRAPLDERLGSERTDLFLNLATAFAQAVSQRPVSSLVDIGYRLGVLRELRMRNKAFEAMRAKLTERRSDPTLEPSAVAPPRPLDAPAGPLESYTSRVWIPAASAFGVSLLSTRSPFRAISAAFSALPKPATMGRDIFANEVGVALAQRGTLVLEPDALKRLDRLDCLLIDGQLLSRARFRVGRVQVHPGEPPRADDAVLAQHVRALFDPRNPLAVQQDRELRLGPPALLGVALRDAAAHSAAAFSSLGSLPLVLSRDEELVAVVEVCISKGVGVEELMHLAERGGMRVVVADEGDDTLAHLGHHHESVPAGDELMHSIRRLQHAGHSVAYVSETSSPALAAADCGIGIHRDGQLPAWGAHILCGDSLDELRTVLRACLMSRGVSKESVNLAMGATAVGTLVSAGAASSVSRRVMFVVNVASLMSMINALRSSKPLQVDQAELLPNPIPWHALEAEGVLARLDSSQSGLREQQVAQRHPRHADPPGALQELGRAITDELFNPLAPLLAAGVGLSALVGSTVDAGIVAGVGGISAVAGGVQRFQTERAIAHLVRPVEQHVQVLRDGHERLVRSGDLVPGDVIELSAGDLVPADCRVLSSDGLQVDSASLTGESLPVFKHAGTSFEPSLADRSCMLYAGTEVVSGQARAVAVEVGPLVEAQRGAFGLSDDPRRQSGVETRLRELMQLTGPVAVAGGLGVVFAGMLRGRSARDLVSSGVSMAVAAIPEGLPVLASAAQLSTAERLSKKGVLVRNSRCIEALGRVDVICLDKTGTLTEGQVGLHLVGDGEHEELLDPQAEPGELQRVVIAAALRASSAGHTHAIHRDPMDAALMRAGAQHRVDRSSGHPGWNLLREHPFESPRGYHAVVGRVDGGLLTSIKGAPERVLQRCSEHALNGVRQALDAQTCEALGARAGELADRGLRILAVAEHVIDGDDAPVPDVAALQGLCFLGFLAFRDPARASAAATVGRLREAGVEVVMLTGDHPRTALSIARDVGMLRDDGSGRVMTGGELARLDDDTIDQRIAGVRVFARVTPTQKVRVVRSLQRVGRTVAMVGDGANDAPALRAAEVGVAVGERSAPAARASADIVFAQADIETLLDGIIEARAMWLSVRDAVSILLGGNLGEIGFGVVGGLISGRSPLNARQLLLVNLMTDVAPAMAVALRKPSERAYAELVRQDPANLLRESLDHEIVMRAVSTTLGASWAWGLGRLTGTRTRASTIGLAALVGAQLGQTMLTRGSGSRVMWTSVGSWALLVALIQTPGLSHLFGCRPMGPVAWSIALGSSAAATGTAALLPVLERQLSSFIDANRDAPWVEPIRAQVSALRELLPSEQPEDGEAKVVDLHV